MDTMRDVIELSIYGDLPKELWPALDWLRVDHPGFRRCFYNWARDCYSSGKGDAFIQLGKHINSHGPRPADPVVLYLNEFFAAVAGRDEDEDGNPSGPVWYIGGKRPEQYTVGELSDFLKSKGVDATGDEIRGAKKLLGISGVRGRRKSG